MKSVLLFTLLTLGLAVSLPAQEGALNSLTDAEKKEGWVLLFDGKTLNGWNSWKTKKQLEAGAWKVEEGTLALEGKGGGDLYTTKAYENYEVSLEWKTTGNSGIMIRVDPAQGGPVYKVAPEMQVDRTEGTSVHSPGALFDIYAPAGSPKVNRDGWNLVRIRIEGQKVTHWLNDTEVYSYVIGSEEWKEKIAGSKWKKTEGYGETKVGHIGLQDHGHAVAYRNLKIRELK